MLRKLVLTFIILALMLGTGCFSGIGPEEIISAVLSDDSGNILIGYRVQRSQEDHDIHLKKVDSNGTVIWDTPLPTGDQRRASVIGMDGGKNGSVYVAWEVLGPEGQRRSAQVMRLSRVDADGQVSFQQEFAERGIQLAAVETGCVIINQAANKERHAIRFDGGGNILWEKGIGSGTGLELAAGENGESFILWGDRDNPYFMAQKLGANGQLLWAQEDALEGVRIKYLETEFWPEPQLNSDGSGGAIITWAEMTGLGKPSYIWVCHIDGSGDVLWSTPARDLTSPINVYTRLVIDGSGEAIVVWEDLRLGMALYAQKVNAEGNPQWSENGLPVCSDLPEVSPRFEAIGDGKGGVVVAWIDGDRRLYTQMLNASGQQQWGDKGILIAKGACYLPVQLCSGGEGGFVVGWSTGWDAHQPNNSYLQKIDSNGNLSWDKKGVKIKP